jgi:hypothetical protein
MGGGLSSLSLEIQFKIFLRGSVFQSYCTYTGICSVSFKGGRGCMDNSSLIIKNQLNFYQGFHHSALYLGSHRYPMGGRGISEVMKPSVQYRTKSTFFSKGCNQSVLYCICSGGGGGKDISSFCFKKHLGFQSISLVSVQTRGGGIVIGLLSFKIQINFFLKDLSTQFLICSVKGILRKGASDHPPLNFMIQFNPFLWTSVHLFIRGGGGISSFSFSGFSQIV